MPARRRNHLEVVWMPGLSINLILAAITYYTALSSALFWCNLGTFGTIVSAGVPCSFRKRKWTAVSSSRHGENVVQIAANPRKLRMENEQK